MNETKSRDAILHGEPWVEAEDQAGAVRRRQAFGSVFTILFMLLIAGLVYVFIPRLPVNAINQALRAALLVLAGLLPVLIYGFFARNRLPTLFVEFKQNLRRLGLPENSEVYQKKFETVYGRAPESQLPAQPFLISETPIIITTLFCIFGWFIVLFPIEEEQTMLLPNLTVLAFGFLGAYMFSVTALMRLYLQDDLQTRYYGSLIARFVAVFILSWLVELMVSFLSPDGYNDEVVLLAAFVVGVFPSAGLATIQRIGSQIFGSVLRGYQEAFPLTGLDGLNAYHEDRLMLEGIDNQQNMASANVVDLMLRTRFTVEQIVDWIDQSLLHLHARERIEAFKQCGYRTATDFLDVFNGIEQTEPAVKTAWRKKMAALLQAQLPTGEGVELDQDQVLALMETIAISIYYGPNFFHVRYWRQHEFEALPEDVERFRTQADLKLMQGSKDEAIEAYNQVLDQFPNSLATRLYLGLAYYQKKDYQKAIREYEHLISQSSARRRTVITAFIELGRAYREQGEYERARASYERALGLDPENLDAHLDLAYLQMARLNEYSQAIDHLNAAIERDFRKPEALANRGLARLELWKRSQSGPAPGGSESEKRTLLDEACSDLEGALRLDPNLIPAYINLAIVKQESDNFAEALARLEEAGRLLESQNGKPPNDPDNAYRARLLRGNIHFGLGDFPAAVENYRVATRIAPYDAAGFYNLGVAGQQLGRIDPAARREARRAFQEVVTLKPGHAPAHQALGDLQLAEGQLDSAQEAYRTALRLSVERGDLKGQALARLSLGRLYRQSGRAEEARRELTLASRLGDEQDDDQIYTESIYELGLLDLAAAQAAPLKEPQAFGRAAALLEIAATLFEALNRPRFGARASLELGNARFGEGKPAEAALAWEQAAKMLAPVYDPANPEDVALKAAIDAARGE